MMTPLKGIECLAVGSESAELIAALHRLSFPGDTGERWQQQDITGILAGPGTRCWIASRAGRPLGYLIMRATLDEAEILSIGVRCDARQRGVGAVLLNRCLAEAGELRVRKIHLEVRQDNVAARRLYEKFSFQAVGQRQGYYRMAEGRTQDAITMMCSIQRIEARA